MFTVIAILVGIIFYRAGIAPLITLALSQVNPHDNHIIAAIFSLAGAVLISITAGVLQLIFIFIMNAVSNFYRINKYTLKLYNIRFTDNWQ